jgi:sulfite exporter TauE/SafE
MTFLIAGLTAGALHVFSGPDHLAALSPLAVVEQKRSWRSGFTWAIGHTAGVMAIGLIGVALRSMISIDVLSSISEQLVGGVLIVIGLWGLNVAVRRHFHSHPHAHGDRVHEHLHAHGKPHRHPDTHRHGHAAVFVGMLHGVAGGSHVVGVLPAMAAPDIADAAAYLTAFGVGTIGAMTLFTSSIGFLAQRIQNPHIYKRLLMAASFASMVVGGMWLSH